MKFDDPSPSKGQISPRGGSTQAQINTLRCTVSSCACRHFTPSANNQRECTNCSHGWIPHAEDKLHHGISDLVQTPQPVNVDVVFDVASLILYGSQAIPIKLKILLDKLLARLQHSEVLQVIYSLAWTYEDYVRGYKYKEGLLTLSSWILPNQDEEKIILRHFAKFPETRDVANKFIQVLEDGKKHQPNSEEARSVYQSKLRGIIASMPSSIGTPSSHVPPVQSPVLFHAMSGDNKSPSHFSLRGPPGLMQPSISLPTKTTQIVNPVPKITQPFSDFSPRIQSRQTITINQNEEIIEPQSMALQSKTSPARSRPQNPSPALFTCTICKRTFRSPLMFKLHKNLHAKDANNSVVLKRKPGAVQKKPSSVFATNFENVSFGEMESQGSSSQPQTTADGILSKVTERKLVSNNELQSLQSLVAHLEKNSSQSKSNDSATTGRPGAQKSPLKCPNVKIGHDVISYPPNASLEIGPGGTMIPTLNCKATASPTSTTGSTSIASNSSRDSSSNESKSGNPSLEFDLEVPVFAETMEGLICGVCHKTYKNKTCLKQHFNNVHLRLQHSCWIKGCNSSFPSKRSRDRHSLNYNLHSHLLQSNGDVIDFSNSTGQSELSNHNTNSNSPESSDEVLPETPNEADDKDVVAENAEQVKMESTEIEENLSIDEMSALMDNTQSAVVWPKPAPVHGEMEF